MTGIEAATVISQNHNVPIIYLTANADMSTINQAKVALPYGYIIKPFTDKDLQTNIEIALYKFENDMKLKMESEQFNTFFDLKDHEKNQMIIHGTKGLEKINIDEVYFLERKDEQTAIIKYATLIQSSKLKPKEVKLVNEIRSVNRYLVEAIKGVHELQENMATYINSENENIRAEYNTLRLKIAKVMREIYRTRNAKDIEEQQKKLMNLKRKAKMHDVLINGKLDYLIRERLITKGMATSLMNDSALVAKIVEWLINVAELLYFHSDSIMAENNKKYESDEEDFFEEKEQ